MYAHSANHRNERHLLHDHLTQVANQSAAYAEALGVPQLGRCLGLWHDIGKIHPDFQRYLLQAEAGRRRRGPDHKMGGALLALKAGLDLACFVLQAHHGGLQNPTELKRWLNDSQRRRAAEQAIALAQETWPSLADCPAGLPEWVQESPLDVELLVRLLLSALVDADYADTAAHFRDLPELPQPPSLSVLWEQFRENQEHLTAHCADTPVNRVRAEIYRHCLAAAEGPPGLFRMTVPTGGGKTRSAMGFALRHALKHDLRHVIVAVPYITITEQTTKEYRKIFGQDVVLEHHSAVDVKEEDQWMRAAAENWDAPIIVTTTVQLFESLFSRRPSKVRKLHRLARSVILLDEAQALPAPLLEPALDVLRALTARFGTSVVLSTATQPAFDVVGPFQRIEAQEIVPHPERYYQALERVTYEWKTQDGHAWAEVAQEMARHPRVLTVVNTKADAVALLEQLGPLVDTPPRHLSTRLCGLHRRDVLDRVFEELSRDTACRLVSTQVVEAGVDIDFPVVMRAMAPLDSIIQAAGRCNREGHMQRGHVIVFQPAEDHLPRGAYKIATNLTRTVLKQYGTDLTAPAAARHYFERLYDTVDLDREGIQDKRRRLDYVATDKHFRIIRDDQVSVLVNYGGRERRKEVETVVDDLEQHRVRPRKALRKLQPYLVQVPRYRVDDLRAQGWITETRLPGLYHWQGRYDDVLGIVTEDESSFKVL